jgi:hypothetical protein
MTSVTRVRIRDKDVLIGDEERPSGAHASERPANGERTARRAFPRNHRDSLAKAPFARRSFGRSLSFAGLV